MSLVDPKTTLSQEISPSREPQWEKFLSDLHDGQCCLLLGPEISCLAPRMGEPDIPVLAAFSEYLGESLAGDLAGRLVEKNLEYDPTISSFYYRADKFIRTQYDADKRHDFDEKIKSFVNSFQQVRPAIFSMLARLPFHSIVNMVPDDFMARALRERGYAFVEDFYDYTNSKRKSPPPELAEEMKMVYNLFGSYGHPESVVITQQEELRFIQNLVGGSPQIPDPVTSRFVDKKKSFLFLGFNFNDWYFRLVIDALKIPKPTFSYYPIFSEHHEVAVLTREFYSEKFGIEFLEPDTLHFLEMVTRDYEERYGAFGRKLSVVLDYYPGDKTDTSHFEVLYTQLELSGIRMRVDLWSRMEVLGGDNEAQVNQATAKADVYIPFLSSEFLKNEFCRQRINTALDQPHTQVIPLISNYGGYHNLVPKLIGGHVMVLPKDETALSDHTGTDLTRHCYKLATLINCMIR